MKEICFPTGYEQPLHKSRFHVLSSIVIDKTFSLHNKAMTKVEGSTNE